MSTRRWITLCLSPFPVAIMSLIALLGVGVVAMFPPRQRKPDLRSPPLGRRSGKQRVVMIWFEPRPLMDRSLLALAVLLLGAAFVTSVLKLSELWLTLKAQSECQTRMSGVAASILSYHDGHRGFRPGTWPKPALKPEERTSWFVAIENDALDSYVELDQAWYTGRNRCIAWRRISEHRFRPSVRWVESRRGVRRDGGRIGPLGEEVHQSRRFGGDVNNGKRRKCAR